jgi:phage terminase large subunit-like protein
MWATCDHKYRKLKNATSGWVVSLSTRVQRDVAQQKVLKYLNRDNIVEIVMLSGRKDFPERGIIDYILVKNKHGTESKIGFRNCEQGREKFQGTSLDWVWFDEEPPFDIYQECLLRTLDRKGSCIWGTMTPLKGKTWVYEELYLNPTNNPDIHCGHMQWEDNPYLSKDEIKRMESNLSVDVLESRKFGHFMHGTGLVFTEFAEENIFDSIKIQDDWYTGISIDPGFTNPLAALWIAVDSDDNIYVAADYAMEQTTVEKHAINIKNISDRLGFGKNDKGNYDAYIDSAATQQTLGNPTSVAQQFINCGIEVNANVDKNVIDGIQHVKSLFCNVHGLRRLFVSRSCTNLIRELKSYWWGDNEKPVKKDDHCIDALRYFVNTDWRVRRKTSKHTKTKKELDRDKQKIMRENRYAGY